MEAATPAPPPPPPPPDPAASAGATYPVRFEAHNQGEYNRFLPLIKWLLAIPHYIVLAFVFLGVIVAVLISFFATIITGRWPRGLFDFCVGAFRWMYRVYAYVFLITDEYPPFSLEDDPNYPVRVEIDYPEHVDRWRPLVHWLLILPYAIVAAILFTVAEIVAFIGVFVILFTEKLPPGMFNLIANPFRWQIRAGAYHLWMATEYPPFDWEE
jgi:hypothetical protein